VSDLQDVIVSSSIKAFNNGVYYERQRLTSLLIELRDKGTKRKLSQSESINEIIIYLHLGSK
jgi:hypothetical protein